MLGSREVLSLALVLIVTLSGCAASPGGPSTVDEQTTGPTLSSTAANTSTNGQTATTPSANGTLEVHFINVG